MKSYRKELWFNTKNRREYTNITPQVEEVLRESGIKEGFLLCNDRQIELLTVFVGIRHRYRQS